MLLAKTLVMALCMIGALLWVAPGLHQSMAVNRHDTPIVVNTWAFTDATEAAWAALAPTNSKSSALDAVEEVGMHAS